MERKENRDSLEKRVVLEILVLWVPWVLLAHQDLEENEEEKVLLVLQELGVLMVLRVHQDYP
jgi:hypothetical protein